MKTTRDRIREVEKTIGLYPLDNKYLETLEEQEKYLDWLLQPDNSARIETNDF